MTKVIISNLGVLALLSLSKAAMFRASISDNSLAATNGEFHLNHIDDAGFVVPVDFGKDVKNVTVALYTSETLLTDNCLSFDKKFCATFKCETTQKGFSASHPHFDAKGFEAGVTATLDSNHWVFAKGNKAQIATNCKGSSVNPIGSKTYGSIGLGFQGNAIKNFHGTKKDFAIFDKQEKFTLQFSPNIDSKLKLSSKIHTDANWKITKVTSLAYGTKTHNLTGTSIIFDINTETIGVPRAIYDFILKDFNERNIKCTQENIDQPTCMYGRDLKDLPNIVLTVDGGKTINIPHQVYAYHYTEGHFQFPFRVVENKLQNNNHVTKAFENTIILGKRLFSEFYVHFDTKDSSVSLYENFSS